MQSDQHRVGTQLQCVMHDIKTRGQVNGTMLRNRFLQHFGVVGLAVTFGTQVMQIDPSVARRQMGHIGGDCRRHCTQRRGVEAGFDFRHCSHVGIMESVRKIRYRINFRRGGKCFAAFTQRGKDRHFATVNTFHVDFIARTFFHPKNERGSGNVFEAGVLDPKLVHPFTFDFNGCGHPQKVRANQRESGFVFKNGGLTLVFK